MENKIIEGNKLIAEFMNQNDNPCRDSYHENWNTLMHVVEKIESIKVNKKRICVKIEQGQCVICDTTIFEKKIASISLEFDKKMESTYTAILEFINWYNAIPQWKINESKLN